MKNKALFTLMCVILLLLQFVLLSAQPKLEFSHEHGFYKSNFQLFIKSTDQEAIIKSVNRQRMSVIALRKPYNAT